MDLATYLPGFMAAYSIQAVGAASPGPAVALLLGLGMAQGRTVALTAALGIGLGAAGLAFAVTQGLGLLMERVGWASAAVRIIGAGYLMWLALKAWHRAATPQRVQITRTAGRTGLARAFATGLVMQLTNPKAIVFWLAVASVGATQGAPGSIVALFVAGAFVISFLIHGAYAVLLSSTPFRLAYDRARRWIEAGIGGLLAFFAFRLATERG